jgi:hypothetical protein
MTKTISVRKKHIVNGAACQPGACPVALAIREQTGMIADVGYSTIRLTKENGIIVNIKSPEKVKSFVDKYDLGAHVRGFKFKLDIHDILPYENWPFLPID